MINLIKQILVIGGWLLMTAVIRLVLLVLFPLFAGLTLAISAERVLSQIVEAKGLRRNLFKSESGKQKQTDGNG